MGKKERKLQSEQTPAWRAAMEKIGDGPLFRMLYHTRIYRSDRYPMAKADWAYVTNEGDIYLNVDKMSTAFGLEVRMPLTDKRIFDIASRMPSKYKVNEEQNKVAFRTAAAKVLPEEIAFRKKLGFIVPIRIWMADERYNQDVQAKFHSDMAAKFFNLDEINAIFDDYIGGNSDNWRKVWTIYTFLVWYEEYFVKR